MSPIALRVRYRLAVFSRRPVTPERGQGMQMMVLAGFASAFARGRMLVDESHPSAESSSQVT
jgi:hypothetical protein